MTHEELKQEAAAYKDSMTDFERITAYGRGEEVDHIPTTLSIGENQATWYGYTLSEFRNSAEVQMDVDRKSMEDFGCGTIKARTLLYPPAVGKAFGSEFASPKNGGEYITKHILEDYSMLDKLHFDPYTSPGLPEKLKNAKEIIAATNGNCRVMCSVVGPLSCALGIREPGKLMRDIKKDKENLHRLLDIAVESQLKWLECNLKEFGKIGLTIFDPASSGDMISPAVYREIVKPHMQDLLRGIKQRYGRIPSMGVMGETSGIWQDIADMGVPSFLVDGKINLTELKNAVGHRMAIAGNVPPVDAMLRGSIDDVIEAVKTALINGSDNPCGFTLSIGGPPPKGIPKENMEAYIYAARRYGRGAKKGCLCKGLSEEGLV